jgi:hypothetical protein
LWRDSGEEADRAAATSPRHVARNDHELRDEAAENIVKPAGRVTNNELDPLAVIKGFDRVGRPRLCKCTAKARGRYA